MKINLKLVLLALLAVAAHATSYTSTSSGNWNSAGVWTPSGIPGSGDSVILANGFTVTVPIGYTTTVGTSGASSQIDIACSGATGTGVLAVAGTFIYRGGVTQCASTWTVAPGAHIQHDSSLAATPSSTNYIWECPSGTNASCALALPGTTGSHIIWDTAIGSGNAGHIGSHVSTPASLTANYVDWSNIGTSGIHSLLYYLTTSAASVSVHNSTCAGCSAPGIAQSVDGSSWSFQNFVLTSGIAVSNRIFAVGEGVALTAKTSGTREIINSFFSGNGAVYFRCAASGVNPGITLNENTVYSTGTTGALTVTAASICSFPTGTELHNTLLWTNPASSSGAYSTAPMGVLLDGYFLGSNSVTCTNENLHLLSVPGGTTVDGWIAEPDCSVISGTINGKFLLSGSGSSPSTLHFTRSMTLPATAGLGGSAGPGVGGKSLAFFDMDGASNCNGSTLYCPVVTSDHNTTYAVNGPSFSGFYSKEGPVTQPVMVAGARDNIQWLTSPGPQGKLGFDNSLANGSLQGVGCNWFFNDTGTGSNYHTAGGNLEYSSPSTPGGAVGSCTGDKTGDPQFVASGRNFIRWCQSLNPSDTTWAQCFAHFASIDAASAGYTPSALIAWVKGGLAPRNALTATADSTGGQIGAMALDALPVYPVMLYTDLDSGPKTGGVNNNGVFITLTGKRFGSVAGTVALGGGSAIITSWADTKIVIQPGAAATTGTINVVLPSGETAACVKAGNCDFTIRAGNVYCVSNNGSDLNNGKFTTDTGGTGCWRHINYRIGLVSGGTGYTVGNQLSIADVPGDLIQVTAVNGGGTITAWTETRSPGTIVYNKTDAAAGGSGTGASFQTQFGAAYQLFPGDTLYFGASSTDTFQSEPYDFLSATYATIWIRPGLYGRSGTVGNPIALVGYPGNSATIGGQDATMYGANAIYIALAVPADYWTVAGLTLIGSAARSTQGNQGTVGLIGKGHRIINNDIQAPYVPGSFGGGLASAKTRAVEGDGIAVHLLGNYLHNINTLDPTLAAGKNDWSKHMYIVYLGSDGNEQELAWNVIDATAQSGHGVTSRCLQVHSSPTSGASDGFPMWGIHVHDNIFTGCGGHTMDFTLDPGRGSGVEYYNNIFYHTGQCDNNSWSGDPAFSRMFFGQLAVIDFNFRATSGKWKFYNNTIYDINSCHGTAGGAFWDGPYNGSSATLAPPPLQVICNSLPCAQHQAGTLQATAYTPYYYPKGVTFETTYPDANIQSAVDDGGPVGGDTCVGNLVQEGTNIGTVNYCTGNYDFTFLRSVVTNASVQYHYIWEYRVDFKNNIVYLKVGEPLYFSHDAYGHMHEWDHNLYYHESGTGAGLQPTWPVKVTNPVGANVDPLWVAKETADFHLQSGSPAIAAGVDTGIARDFDGYLRTQFDLGAYAYRGGGVVTQIPPTVTFPNSATLPSGTVGQAYNNVGLQFIATGSGSMLWSAAALPPGLTMDTSGLLSGIPTQAGAYTAAVLVTNGVPPAGGGQYAIVISPAPVINGSQATGAMSGAAK